MMRHDGMRYDEMGSSETKKDAMGNKWDIRSVETIGDEIIQIHVEIMQNRARRGARGVWGGGGFK